MYRRSPRTAIVGDGTTDGASSSSSSKSSVSTGRTSSSSPPSSLTTPALVVDSEHFFSGTLSSSAISAAATAAAAAAAAALSGVGGGGQEQYYDNNNNCSSSSSSSSSSSPSRNKRTKKNKKGDIFIPLKAKVITILFVIFPLCCIAALVICSHVSSSSSSNLSKSAAFRVGADGEVPIIITNKKKKEKTKKTIKIIPPNKNEKKDADADADAGEIKKRRNSNNDNDKEKKDTIMKDTKKKKKKKKKKSENKKKTGGGGTLPKVSSSSPSSLRPSTEEEEEEKIQQQKPPPPPPSSSILPLVRNTKKIFPRIIKSYNTLDGKQQIVKLLSPLLKSPYKIKDSSSKPKLIPKMTSHDKYLEYVNGDCVPMYEWQIKSFPSCNTLHEIDLYPNRGKNHVLFLGSGGSRSTFRLEIPSMLTSSTLSTSKTTSTSTSTHTIVLKNQKYYKDADSYLYEKQRIDGLVMERATSSPYVPDIYGFCGTSLLNEYSDGGAFYDYFWYARNGNGSGNGNNGNDNGEEEEENVRRKEDNNHNVTTTTMTSSFSIMDQLRVSVQLAKGVAHVQNVDRYGIPTFAHNDVCCHQFLFMNGIFKLNDFDNGIMLRKNVKTGKLCKEELHMKLFKIRAPEEFQSKLYNDYEPMYTDKIDVYMLGNVLYYLLTNQYMFQDISKEEGAELIRRGKRSPFPLHIQQSNHPAIKAMKKAIEMCWIHDPLHRPSASNVANYLMQALQKLQDANNDKKSSSSSNKENEKSSAVVTVTVTLPERDSNYVRDESEWELYL